jgi:hypothetical protein
MAWKVGIAGLVTALALCVWWLGRPAVPSKSKPKTEVPATLVLPSAPPSATQGSPLAARIHAANGSGQEDVEVLHEVLTQYLTAMQNRPGPPIGDDQDLARVLKGRNPLRRPVVAASHPMFSADGRLRDRWGSPYHIHAISTRRYEIRSAGPDRELFTADDLLHPPPPKPEP